jgi:hypothetical protein
MNRCKYGTGAVVAGVQSLFGRDGLPFASAFSADEIAPILEEDAARFRDNGPFSRLTTLFAFLMQVLSPDPSCSHAVKRINADRIAKGLKPTAAATSSYCKARGRLRASALHRLSCQCARALEADVAKNWAWHDRRVLNVDGTMITAADTPINRAIYPHHHAHQKGCGYPSIRLVAVSSLASGVIMDAAFGSIEGGSATSEHTLSLDLVRRCSRRGDVVVGDRLYDSFRFIATVVHQGGDYVGRIQKRPSRCDFRRGERLGKDDHIVFIEKPEKSKAWDPKADTQLPQRLALRVVRVVVESPGRRAKVLWLATTLLSPRQFPKEELAELYRRRWSIEVDLRTLKRTIHLNHLTSRTPSMLATEIWAHLLAYNAVRKLMAQAAWLQDREPREVSFKGALETLLAYGPLWNSRLVDADTLYALLLESVAKMRVGNRPGRCEPRARKCKTSKFRALRKARTIATARYNAQS